MILAPGDEFDLLAPIFCEWACISSLEVIFCAVREAHMIHGRERRLKASCLFGCILGGKMEATNIKTVPSQEWIPAAQKPSLLERELGALRP